MTSRIVAVTFTIYHQNVDADLAQHREAAE